MKHYYTLELFESLLREKDFRGLAAFGFKVVRSKILGYKTLVFARNSHNSDSTAPAEMPSFKMRVFKSWQAVDDNIKQQLRQNDHFLESLIKNGAWLWAGYCDDEFTNAVLTFRGDKKRRYYFPLDEKCVVISHCITMPQYRRLGLYKTSLAYVLNELAQNGQNLFYIDCSDWNFPSIKAIEAVGFTLIGEGQHKRKDQLLWRQKTKPSLA
jgi:hypothetical protein